MHVTTKLLPGITRMIQMDHTKVLGTFHKYRLDLPPAKKEALVNTICTSLEIHAQLEEEIFYPAMRSTDREMIDKSVPEHQEMRRLINDLRSMRPGDRSYDMTLMELMGIVIHHVADEETKLLPEAERVLHGRLAELGWEMTRRRMQLMGPRTGDIAVNMARAYPVAAISVAASDSWAHWR